MHDWLTGMRGGEAVLEGILEVLPNAEIFTLFHFPGSVSPAIESRKIYTSFLQDAATRADDYRRLLPLFPRAARKWDFSKYDLIVSSSHCVAKGIDAKGKPHLCYCHTPMRYIWDRFDDYFPRSKPMQRAAMMSIAPWLRRWDVQTAGEVTAFVANSNFVKDRIRRYYDRDAEVIHPFVDDVFLEEPPTDDREDYHLVVSALVPYKRIELAIDAGRRLVVIGSGPMLESLRKRSGPNVTFMGNVPRATIVERLKRARTLILPGIEDFGITPLEAMALGTPVVAFGEGGVLDTVVDGRTGILFREPSAKALAATLEAAESRAWDRPAIRARAAAFTREQFRQRFAAAVERVRR